MQSSSPEIRQQNQSRVEADDARQRRQVAVPRCRLVQLLPETLPDSTFRSAVDTGYLQPQAALKIVR